MSDGYNINGFQIVRVHASQHVRLLLKYSAKVRVVIESLKVVSTTDCQLLQIRPELADLQERHEASADLRADLTHSNVE